MTARTTAHLASALDDRYYKFITMRSEEEAGKVRAPLDARVLISKMGLERDRSRPL
jgi:hypothetical protein